MAANSFWLFVGVVDFSLGFELAQLYLAEFGDVVVILMGLLAVVPAAATAVFLQYVAVGISGSLSGGYIVLTLLRLANIDPNAIFPMLTTLFSGLFSLLLVLILFDWALVILSASIDAAMMTTSLHNIFALQQWLQTMFFVLLVITGIAFQYYQFLGKQQTRQRRLVVQQSTQ